MKESLQNTADKEAAKKLGVATGNARGRSQTARRISSHVAVASFIRRGGAAGEGEGSRNHGWVFAAVRQHCLQTSFSALRLRRLSLAWHIQLIVSFIYPVCRGEVGASQG